MPLSQQEVGKLTEKFANKAAVGSFIALPRQSRQFGQPRSGGAGTFFVNCLRICTCQTDLLPVYYAKVGAASVRHYYWEYAPCQGNCSVNQAALVRMVEEGHLLGDHSSDHMAHNHVGKGYHYWSGTGAII